MSSVLTMSEPATDTPATDTPATAPRCADCDGVLYAGECLAVGYCETADRTATRGASRTSAKYQPAAWTIAGGVD